MRSGDAMGQSGEPTGARLRELARMYEEQHAAARRSDPAVVRRALRPSLLDSELFLVGLALGRDTQRLSGLPYVFPGGPPHKFSKGGVVLDRWLDIVGYTINPDDPDRAYAYHADLHAGFPGRKPTGSGDLQPTSEEIERGARFLQKEIEIVRPTVLIALGKQPALHLLARYGDVHLERLAQATGRRWEICVGSLRLPLLAAYHPSGAFQHQSQSEAAWQFVQREIKALGASRAP